MRIHTAAISPPSTAPQVLNAAFQLRGLTSGALLGGLIAAVWMRKLRPQSVILGMVASFSVMALIAWKTQVFWPWFTVIGTTTMLGTAILANQLITPRGTVSVPPRP